MKRIIPCAVALALVACSDPAHRRAADRGAADGGTADGGSTESEPAPAQRADIYARAAAVLGSCLDDDGVNRNLAYLWNGKNTARFWGRFAQRATCLATRGGGCSAARECTGYSLALGAEGCVPGCQGSVFHECYDRAQLAIDCSKLGMVCSPDSGCADPDSLPCDDGSLASCAGEVAVTCSDGATHGGPDCAALGLHCESGACRGAGASCVSYDEEEYAVTYQGLSCAGNTLRSCVGGREHELDCSALGAGFSCRERDGVLFCGLAAECVPAELPNYDQRGTGVACDGSVLTVCNAGRLTSVDCKQLGFQTCDAEHEACAPGFIDLRTPG